jgi:diaminopimelate decarboxylase
MPDRNTLEDVAARYGTPVHLYDERGITANAKAMIDAFAWNPGFRQHFAVKATPTPAILSILHDTGMGMDCSSLAELELCRRLGIPGDEIMFTSNDTPAEEYRAAFRMGAIINLDDTGHIDFLIREAGLPHRLCLRYNPGCSGIGNSIIGRPREAKFGIPLDQMLRGCSRLRDLGVESLGLHTMVVSNELDPAVFASAAGMLFDLAAEVRDTTGLPVDFVNLGGGLGIPYRPDQEPLDMKALSARIRSDFLERLDRSGGCSTSIFTECGRFVTGPYGCLLARVLHVKRTYRTFVGLDACMADLMRPGMYGAYHHVSVVGREPGPDDIVCDVTGSLCENNDRFAVDRSLPPAGPGDLVVIHDTGAHGHAMGFNYNGRLRSAEVLLRSDGSTELIRRAETLDDYFATVVFGQLPRTSATGVCTGGT